MQSPTATGPLPNVITMRISNDSHDTKSAHSMTNILKKGDNVSGNLGEYINVLFTTYMEAALDFETSPTQKIIFKTFSQHPLWKRNFAVFQKPLKE